MGMKMLGMEVLGTETDVIGQKASMQEHIFLLFHSWFLNFYYPTRPAISISVFFSVAISIDGNRCCSTFKMQMNAVVFCQGFNLYFNPWVLCSKIWLSMFARPCVGVEIRDGPILIDRNVFRKFSPTEERNAYAVGFRPNNSGQNSPLNAIGNNSFDDTVTDTVSRLNIS